MLAEKRKHTEEPHVKMLNHSTLPSKKRPPPVNHPGTQPPPPAGLGRSWKPPPRGPSGPRGPPLRGGPPPRGGRGGPRGIHSTPRPRPQSDHRDPYADEFDGANVSYRKGRPVPRDPYLEDPYYEHPYYEDPYYGDPYYKDRYYQRGYEDPHLGYESALEEPYYEAPQDYHKPKQEGFDGKYGADEELKTEIMDKIMLFGGPNAEPLCCLAPTKREPPPHRPSMAPPHRPPMAPPHRPPMELNFRPVMEHRPPRPNFRVKIFPRPLVPDRAPRKMPSVLDKGTVKTLMKIRPDAKFKEKYSYGSDMGFCVCWSVEFADAIFEAEGTTPYIARGLAAYDALAHLGAPGYPDCELICNTLDETRACQINREAHIDKQLLDYEEQERSIGEGRVDQQTLNYTRANLKGSMDYLSKKSEKFEAMRKIHGYGKLDIEDYFGQNNQVGVQVKLVLQDGRYAFTECGHSKRAALNNIALRVEQVICAKPSWLDVEDSNHYKSFQEHIIEKAHNFTKVLLAEFASHYVRQHNYACIIKVEGEAEVLEKCTIVAFGNGTKIVEKTKMKSDGSVINDCCGEALAYRAFRRYLLNQIEMCGKGDTSIFTRDSVTQKFELNPEIKFILFKNYSPFGDARYFDTDKDSKETKNDKIDRKYKKKQKKTESARKAWEYKKEDEGKIQLYKLQDTTIATHRDLTGIPREEEMDMFHSIVSPSDKMALRAICGCQGALLSLLLKDSIYMTEYHIQFQVGTSVSRIRMDALERGLYGRLAEGTYEDPCPKPIIKSVKAKWMKHNLDKDDIVPYSFLWFEGGNVDILRSTEGKSVQRLRPEHTEVLSTFELATIDKQELQTATPSKYCTANYYTIFTYVCKILDIPVDSYVQMKNRAEKYMRNKLSVYEELRQKGLGEWPDKHIYADF